MYHTDNTNTRGVKLGDAICHRPTHMHVYDIRLRKPQPLQLAALHYSSITEKRRTRHFAGRVSASLRFPPRLIFLSINFAIDKKPRRNNLLACLDVKVHEESRRHSRFRFVSTTGMLRFNQCRTSFSTTADLWKYLFL